MKRYILIVFSFLISLSVFSQGLITVDTREFGKRDDSLSVDLLIRINPHSIETGQGLRISPWVEAGDSLLSLSPITVLGGNKQRVIARFNRDVAENSISARITNDTVLSYAAKVPYALWMDSARLSVLQETSGYRGRNTVIAYRLKDGPEATTALPAGDTQFTDTPAFRKYTLKHQHNKAYLDFPVGNSVILPGYMRNSVELAKIERNLREVVDKPDARLQSLYIVGYASPDGLYKTNEHLSCERALALKEYIQNKFSLDESLFTVSSVAEDWEGLAEQVRASDLPQKDRILEIIATVGIDKGRELALMRLDKGVPYLRMLKEMFPVLRRVEYRIDYWIDGYEKDSVEEEGQ